MLGNLNDAPEWDTHYVERVGTGEDEEAVFLEGVYWFINFNNYRWTVYNQPDKEYIDSSAEDLVTEDIQNNPDSFLVIELNVSLENE